MNKPISLTRFLSRLIWLSLLPLILAAVWGGYRQVERERHNLEEHSRHLAALFGDEVERFLQSRLAALQMLAESSLLDDPPRLEDFHRRAFKYQQSFGGHVILADGDLQMLLNTRAPYGTPLPRLPQPQENAVSPAVLASGKPQVSDIVQGPLAGTQAVGLVVAVDRPGKPRRLLLATFETAQLQKMIDSVQLPEGRRLHLFDSTGQVIAARGRPPSGGMDENAHQFTVKTGMGRWVAELGISAGAYRAPLYTAAYQTLFYLLCALLIAGFGSRWASRRLLRAVEALPSETRLGQDICQIREIGAVRDVIETQRRQLQESESRYRSLFENSHSVMLLIDPTDGRIVDANPAAEIFYGWSRQTLQGMSIGQINTLSPDEVAKQMEAARITQRNIFHFRHRRADGSIREVEVHSGPIRMNDRVLLYSIIQDETERLAAERALSEALTAASRFRTALDHVQALAYIKDRESRYVYANRHMLDLFGSDGLTIVGRPDADFFPPATAARLREADRRVLAGESIAEEIDTIMPDGSRRVFWQVMSPLYLDDNRSEVWGISGIATDITERRRLEQKIRQLAQAVEQSPESIAIANLDAELEYVNEAFVAATGYSREEALGQNPRILQSGKTPHATYEAMWDALTHGRPWQGELFNRRKDGTEYVEWARISPVRQADGRITHYLAIKQDITLRRQMEQELKRALEVVEESPNVGFRWRATAGWPVEYVSRNIRRWGYSPEDLTSGRIAYPDLVHPDDLARVAQEVADNTARRMDEYVQQYRVRAADGHYFWVEDYTRIVRSPEGDPLTYEGIVTDVDERKRHEIDLSENLARQKELNRKLEEAQNQLLQSEKMASLGQLAAGVAHELNNPIGYVGSNLGTLEQYLRDIFEVASACEQAALKSAHPVDFAAIEEMKKRKDFAYISSDIFQLVAESRSGLERVRRIVQDLKDFSRPGEAQMQWADLHAGLDSTLNIAHNELKYKCEIVKEYGELPQVWCEASQINQVFLNLLVNAGHAIADKGHIVIRTGRRGDEVFIAISDDGAGIPPENLSRIFEPFFTTKPVGKGTGLGLSLAYSIVAKHHGRIEVESTVGQGSTFTVWLPIAPAAGENGAVPPAPTLPSP